MYTHDDDDDDWFVLLDVTPNESGICFYFPVWGGFAAVFFAPRFCGLLKRYAEVTLRHSVSTDGSVRSLLVHGPSCSH